MRRWSFAKGHGTENDFVILLDREALLHPGPAEVRAICDRHAGVGADGLLRAVLGKHVPEWAGDPEMWFMDYHNADGSVAEMCGNGIRVFVRYLLDEDLAFGPTVQVGTRAGLKEVTTLPDGQLRVAMGPVRVGPGGVRVTTMDGRSFAAVAVDVGNPHAVSFTEDVASVPLYQPPAWEPAEAFPEGVNQEFVQLIGDHRIAMRVFERGSGETRSCGTGTVAAAAAAHAGADLPAAYQVDVPGGSVTVDLAVDQAYLTGPAVIVAHGELALPEFR